MPVFPLRLEKTYYEKGFFNITVDFDRYIDSQNGSIEIVLGDDSLVTLGRIDRTANMNGTARIVGNKPLREFFQKNFRQGDSVSVEIISPNKIIIHKKIKLGLNIMPVSIEQQKNLSNAVNRYAFPCIYYDFTNNCPLEKPNMREIERVIRDDLISSNPDLVKNGLSNVLYWGYAQVGYRDTRVDLFRSKVTKGQLLDASQLFQNIHGDGLREIKQIRLPQFSGMSFISKVRMFLDPENYVILDQQILKMNTVPVNTVLKDINFSGGATQILVSKNNSRVYLQWCKKCIEISAIYFNNIYRAVDIERGFFTLIQQGQVNLAAEILSKA